MASQNSFFPHHKDDPQDQIDPSNHRDSGNIFPSATFLKEERPCQRQYTGKQLADLLLVMLSTTVWLKRQVNVGKASMAKFKYQGKGQGGRSNDPHVAFVLL